MARRRRPFFKKRRRMEDDDFTSMPPRRRIQINNMKKGIFILPSLLTLTSIFCAFYGTVFAIRSQFVLSAALILAAGFFDGIDGKVARLTHTTSRFGLELDSLADVISFGMAPAILMYMWVLDSMPKIGWVSGFLFVACGALRLARFNVQSGTIDPKRFNGLPIPGAAAMMATTVLFFHKMELNPADFKLTLLLLTTFIAVFMVSNIKFHAFKDLTLVKQNPFGSTVAFVLLLALIAVQPFVVPFFLCAGYVVSGPIVTLRLYLRNKKKQAEQMDEPESEKGFQEAAPANDSGT
jgi:CDP-diacylglycerol---serine O-phosphatidyltransferase